MHQTRSVWIWLALSNVPLNTQTERNTERKWETAPVLFFFPEIISLRANGQIRYFCWDALRSTMAEWQHESVLMLQQVIRSVFGLKPATELRQMINNLDFCRWCLFMSVMPFFPSLSLRISFFWEALRGKLSCFHVKGVLLSVCFPGCLKLFTVPGGFHSLYVCIRVSVCERNTVDDAKGRQWFDICVSSLSGIRSTGEEFCGGLLIFDHGKGSHRFSAKCWHKISQTRRWPFWVSRSRAGARGQKLAECVVEIIPPWHFRDLGPLVFNIPVQAPKRKCHLFYLLEGIQRLNVTLRPGHDSSTTSMVAHKPTLTHTHTLGMCPRCISDILNNADAWPCWGNLSHTGNLE